ncbi:MAG: hypothetical protein AAFQ79_18360 [Pseudomonadota bacterium]
MLAACLRIGLVIALTTGLILPKMGGVLAGFVPGVMQVVICTGTEMVTVTLGPDGQPIETEVIEGEPCVMTAAALPADTALPLWHRLARDHRDAFSAVVLDRAPPRLFAVKWPSQAPPRRV